MATSVKRKEESVLGGVLEKITPMLEVAERASGVKESFATAAPAM